MRVEFTVLDKLADGLTSPAHRLDFDLLYGRYRDLASGFRDYKTNRGAYESPLSLLLTLRARGLVPEHDFQSLLASQSRATRARYLKRARGLKEMWESVPGIIARLPLEGPPDAPDVERTEVIAK
jgi:hypothetical protein